MTIYKQNALPRFLLLKFGKFFAKLRSQVKGKSISGVPEGQLPGLLHILHAAQQEAAQQELQSLLLLH